MATRPDLRAGDADREATAAALREHYAHGRLSLEEFNHRLDAVFAATTQGQLDAITRDLPHVRTPSVPLPVATAAYGPGGGGRSGGGRGRSGRRDARRPMSMIGSLVAIFVVFVSIWLIELAPYMLHFRFPLPGRLGVLLAGLMIIRRLIRRIFGGLSRWNGGAGPGGRFGGRGYGRSW
jgi:Domain of unknown function (DUF1707)